MGNYEDAGKDASQMQKALNTLFMDLTSGNKIEVLDKTIDLLNKQGGNKMSIDKLIDDAYEHAVDTWNDDDIQVIRRIINRAQVDFRSPYTVYMSQDALADTVTTAFYAGMKMYEAKKKAI